MKTLGPLHEVADVSGGRALATAQTSPITGPACGHSLTRVIRRVAMAIATIEDVLEECRGMCG